MKKILLCLPLLCFLFVSCSKEDVDEVQQPQILSINLMATAVAQQSQEVSVTIKKPTPCHKITDVQVTSLGNTVDYNFIVTGPGGDIACAQVIQEETVTVNFESETGGEYTLNFFINGILEETRTIVVTD